jgi:hypothetical protein
MRTHVWRGVAVAAAITIFSAAAAIAADDNKPTKTVKKLPSVCVGLDVNACGTKSECYWKQQITTKNGKTRKAHCRKRPFQQIAKKTA